MSDARAILTGGYWVTGDGQRVAIPSNLRGIYELAWKVLTGVDGVGNVYPYRPAAPSQVAKVSLFTVTGEDEDDLRDLNAWFFSRTTSAEELGTAVCNEVTHTIVIEGFWADGEPHGELTFQHLVDDIAAAFRDYPDAESAEVENASLAEPLQINEVNAVKFLDRYYCHHCTLTWKVTQDVTWYSDN